MIYILIVIVILIIIMISYLIFLHNKLNKLKSNIEKEYSNIDSNFKIRVDLIPKLIDEIRPYIKKNTLIDQLIELKNIIIESDDLKILLDTDLEISEKLDELFALLKKKKIDSDVINEINLNEEELINNRINYNREVSIYNAFLDKFPARIFSGILGFKKIYLSRENDE